MSYDRTYEVLAERRKFDTATLSDDRQFELYPEDRVYDVSEEERVLEVLPA